MKCLLGSCNSGGSWFGFVLIGALVTVVGVKFAQMRPADTPAAMVTTGLSLEDALEQGEAQGKPVLAFATASWCGPCQSLKRNGLADPGVQALIDSRTVAVTLEETTEVGAAGIRQLPVESFPTLLLIQDGKVLSMISGAHSAERLTGWLQENTANPVTDPIADPAADSPAEPTSDT